MGVIKPAARNNTIDILRLVASLFIIFLHIRYGVKNQWMIVIIRLMARWAVPFFFMVSGYFYQKSLESAPDAALRVNLTKILSIIIIANIVYIPMAYLNHHLFLLQNLFTGDYFHLWFLHALLIGFIAVYGLYKLKAGGFLSLAIALLIYAAVLLSHSYTFVIGYAPADKNAFVPFLSIPFMIAGTVFYKKNGIKNKVTLLVGIIAATVGFIIQLAEVKQISTYAGGDMQFPQFLFGTPVFATGMFIIALKWNLKSELLGKWGRNYSLFIYLYHPFLLGILHALHLGGDLTGVMLIVFPLIIFVCILAIAIFLDKYVHRLFLLFNGSIADAFKRGTEYNRMKNDD